MHHHELIHNHNILKADSAAAFRNEIKIQFESCSGALPPSDAATFLFNNLTH